jgi:hypothetical protein
MDALYGKAIALAVPVFVAAIFAIAAGLALASLADLWLPARKSTAAAAEPLAA